MNIENVIVLAGGDGTRFWPLKGKSTIPFLNKPIFKHVIDGVSSYAKKITIVVSETKEQFVKNLFPKAQVIVQDKAKIGMGGAVISCKDKVRGNVLILNAEDMFNFTIFEKYLEILESGNKDFIFLIKTVTNYFPGAYLKFEGDKISEIIEKPPIDKLPSDKTKLVAEYFSDFEQFIVSLENSSSQNDDWYEQAINNYLTVHTNGASVEYQDYWQAFKFPWHILPMTKIFLKTLKGKHLGSNAVISKNSVITGNVHIGNNVKIGDFVKISGPVFIGDDVIIGDHTLVRESHIGNNVLIGGGSEVARSYISDGVMLHRNYVGDSVLDNNVLMGAGAVTANFRFDGKTIISQVGDKKIDSQQNKFGCIIGADSKIGVNGTILPGIKIGSHSYIGPGQVVVKDIPDDIFFFNDQLTKNTK